MGDLQKAPKKGHIVNPVNGCKYKVACFFFPRETFFVSAKVRSI